MSTHLPQNDDAVMQPVSDRALIEELAMAALQFQKVIDRAAIRVIEF